MESILSARWAEAKQMLGPVLSTSCSSSRKVIRSRHWCSRAGAASGGGCLTQTYVLLLPLCGRRKRWDPLRAACGSATHPLQAVAGTDGQLINATEHLLSNPVPVLGRWSEDPVVAVGDVLAGMSGGPVIAIMLRPARTLFRRPAHDSMARWRQRHERRGRNERM